MPAETATREEWAARTEHARRLSRFRYALRRASLMADGTPPFTDDELDGLAAVFTSRKSGERAA